LKTVRILSTSINGIKPLAIGLCGIYGIGRARADSIIK
jgi:ribosomal protein S13